MKVLFEKLIIILFLPTLALVLIAVFNPTMLREVNCSLFSNKSDAYNFFSSNPIKYQDLDRDRDGIPCEHLPN